MESVNAVGRRKAAVARVIVKEGNGAINITCNHARRTLDKYFPSSILQYIVLQPLKTLDCTDNTTSRSTSSAAVTKARPRLSVSPSPALW